jgi:hypothetical protein
VSSETINGFRVVASTHLRYYPGTMNETPKGYRHEIHSEVFPTPHQARGRMLDWAEAVESPGWEFRVEPVAADRGTAKEGH